MEQREAGPSGEETVRVGTSDPAGKLCPICGARYPATERFCTRDGTALRSMEPQEDLVGATIGERYAVLKRLGHGGMGTVYLARHVRMGRNSAIKVMNPGLSADPDAVGRFNREAANAAQISHPNVCSIYDFGETDDGLVYLAMEFIEGQTLTGLLQREGPMPAARCGRIVRQIAEALEAAHERGIVHRDLKPDNVMMVQQRDGSDLVKVVDFGIARSTVNEAQKVTRTGVVVGTPQYMSPEQLAGEPLDRRSDVYSLGLVAFNCLTCELPFAGDSVAEMLARRLTERPRRLSDARHDGAWSAELQRTVDKALERDPALRYQTAAQFGREFEAACAASAQPVSRRLAWKPALAALVAVAVGAGSVVLYLQSDSGSRPPSTAEIVPAVEAERAAPIEATADDAPRREARTARDVAVSTASIPQDHFPDGEAVQRASSTDRRVVSPIASEPAARADPLAQLALLEREDFGVPPSTVLHGGAMHGPTPTSIPGGQVITTRGVMDLLEDPTAGALVLDVLGGPEKLPGAIHAVAAHQAGHFGDVVQQQFFGYLQSLTGGRDDLPLVFYCESTRCWMSYNAALRAINMGFRNVLWYRGGIEAWKAAGQRVTPAGA